VPKIVIDCANPNDFTEVMESAERAAGNCTITYAKQHLEMEEAGTSDSIRESARILSEDAGETAESARQKIMRGLDMVQHEPDTDSQAEPDSKSQFRTSFTGENEWYTPEKYIASVRNVLGEIDLDPASSDIAQEKIKATKYFTKENDGLESSWNGTVWLNPPYAQPLIYLFVEKLVSEYEAGKITEAILLTNNYTDTAWFHLAESKAALICFTRGRVKFESPSGEMAAPTQGSAFFYFGPNPSNFKQEFKKHGFVR